MPLPYIHDGQAIKDDNIGESSQNGIQTDQDDVLIMNYFEEDEEELNIQDIKQESVDFDFKATPNMTHEVKQEPDNYEFEIRSQPVSDQSSLIPLFQTDSVETEEIRVEDILDPESDDETQIEVLAFEPSLRIFERRLRQSQVSVVKKKEENVSLNKACKNLTLTEEKAKPVGETLTGQKLQSKHKLNQSQRKTIKPQKKIQCKQKSNQSNVLVHAQDDSRAKPMLKYVYILPKNTATKLNTNNINEKPILESNKVIKKFDNSLETPSVLTENITTAENKDLPNIEPSFVGVTKLPELLPDFQDKRDDKMKESNLLTPSRGLSESQDKSINKKKQLNVSQSGGQIENKSEPKLYTEKAENIEEKKQSEKQQHDNKNIKFSEEIKSKVSSQKIKKKNSLKQVSDYWKFLLNSKLTEEKEFSGFTPCELKICSEQMETHMKNIGRNFVPAICQTNSGSLYKCVDCSYTTCFPSSLVTKKHISFHESTYKTFECLKCDFRSFVGDVVNHSNIEHKLKLSFKEVFNYNTKLRQSKKKTTQSTKGSEIYRNQDFSKIEPIGTKGIVLSKKTIENQDTKLLKPNVSKVLDSSKESKTLELISKKSGAPNESSENASLPTRYQLSTSIDSSKSATISKSPEIDINAPILENVSTSSSKIKLKTVSISEMETKKNSAPTTSEALDFAVSRTTLCKDISKEIEANVFVGDKMNSKLVNNVEHEHDYHIKISHSESNDLKSKTFDKEISSEPCLNLRKNLNLEEINVSGEVTGNVQDGFGSLTVKTSILEKLHSSDQETAKQINSSEIHRKTKPNVLNSQVQPSPVEKKTPSIINDQLKSLALQHLEKKKPNVLNNQIQSPALEDHKGSTNMSKYSLVHMLEPNSSELSTITDNILLQHMKRICSICLCSQRTCKDLAIHVRTAHSLKGEKNPHFRINQYLARLRICVQCGHFAVDRRYLTIHYLVEHNSQPTSMIELYESLGEISDNLKTRTCNCCGYIARNVQGLAAHWILCTKKLKELLLMHGAANKLSSSAVKETLNVTPDEINKEVPETRKVVVTSADTSKITVDSNKSKLTLRKSDRTKLDLKEIKTPISSNATTSSTTSNNALKDTKLSLSSNTVIKPPEILQNNQPALNRNPSIQIKTLKDSLSKNLTKSATKDGNTTENTVGRSVLKVLATFTMDELQLAQQKKSSTLIPQENQAIVESNSTESPESNSLILRLNELAKNVSSAAEKSPVDKIQSLEQSIQRFLSPESKEGGKCTEDLTKVEQNLFKHDGSNSELDKNQSLPQSSPTIENAMEIYSVETVENHLLIPSKAESSQTDIAHISTNFVSKSPEVSVDLTYDISAQTSKALEPKNFKEHHIKLVTNTSPLNKNPSKTENTSIISPKLIETENIDKQSKTSLTSLFSSPIEESFDDYQESPENLNEGNCEEKTDEFDTKQFELVEIQEPTAEFFTHNNTHVTTTIKEESIFTEIEENGSEECQNELTKQKTVPKCNYKEVEKEQLNNELMGDTEGDTEENYPINEQCKENGSGECQNELTKTVPKCNSKEVEKEQLNNELMGDTEKNCPINEQCTEINIDIKKENRSVICPYCRFKFSNLRSLKRHKISCAELYSNKEIKYIPSKKLFGCSRCSYTSASMSGIKNHIYHNHKIKDSLKKAKLNARYMFSESLKQYLCSQCDYRTRRLHYLGYHITKAHPDPPDADPRLLDTENLENCSESNIDKNAVTEIELNKADTVTEPAASDKIRQTRSRSNSMCENTQPTSKTLQRSKSFEANPKKIDPVPFEAEFATVTIDDVRPLSDHETDNQNDPLFIDSDIDFETLENILGISRVCATIKCKKCDYIAESDKDLKEHSLKHKQLEIRRRSSRISPKSSFSEVDSADEINKSSSAELACDMCGYNATTRKSLKIHVEDNHINAAAETFENDTSVLRDIKEYDTTCNMYSVEFRTCEFCGHIAGSRGGLSRHLKASKKCGGKGLIFKKPKVSVENDKISNQSDANRNHKSNLPTSPGKELEITAPKSNSPTNLSKEVEKRTPKEKSIGESSNEIKNKQNKESFFDSLTDNQRTRSCFLCGWIAKTQGGLNYHLTIRHFKSELYDKSLPGTIPCEMCLFKAKSKRRLAAHHNLVHKMVYGCANCSFKANDKNLVTIHTETAHKKGKASNETTEAKVDKPTDFSDSNEKIHININQLKVYQNTNYGVQIQKSNVKDINIEPQVTTPIVNVLPRSSLKCNLCSFRALDQLTLEDHVFGHEIGMYPCNLCSFMTKWNSNLSKHKAQVHKDIGNGKPDVPRDITQQISESKKEDGKETTVELEMHPCNLCSFVTKRSLDLIKHKAHVHSDVGGGKRAVPRKTTQQISESKKEDKDESVNHEMHSCDVCSFMTEWSSDLLKHKAHVHRDKEDSLNHDMYACRDVGGVGKQAIPKKTTQQIIEIKKGEKEDRVNHEMYSCNLCSFMSKYGSNLRRHLAQVHKPESANLRKYDLRKTHDSSLKNEESKRKRETRETEEEKDRESGKSDLDDSDLDKLLMELSDNENVHIKKETNLEDFGKDNVDEEVSIKKEPNLEDLDLENLLDHILIERNVDIESESDMRKKNKTKTTRKSSKCLKKEDSEDSATSESDFPNKNKTKHANSTSNKSKKEVYTSSESDIPKKKRKRMSSKHSRKEDSEDSVSCDADISKKRESKNNCSKSRKRSREEDSEDSATSESDMPKKKKTKHDYSTSCKSKNMKHISRKHSRKEDSEDSASCDDDISKKMGSKNNRSTSRKSGKHSRKEDSEDSASCDADISKKRESRNNRSISSKPRKHTRKEDGEDSASSTCDIPKKKKKKDSRDRGSGKTTVMFKCPYCNFKAKFRHALETHFDMCHLD